MKTLIKLHLQLVFNNLSGYSSILAIKNGLKSIFIPFSISNITDDLLDKIISLNNSGYNIYFTPNIQNTKPIKDKCSEEDISLQTCMIVEINIEGCDKHKSIGDKKYTPNIETAISLLPITPSFIVKTGYGVQAYYLFNEPITPNSNSKIITRSYIKFIRNKAKKLGITEGIDYVQSLEHMFRLAGTKNYKKVNKVIPTNSPIASICNRSNLTYSQDSFLEYTNFNKLSPESQVVSDENVEWAKYFLLRIPASSLNYEQWSNVVRICISLGLISEVDEWSQKDTERYNGMQSLIKSYKNTDLTISTLISYLPDNDNFKLGTLPEDNAIRVLNMYNGYFYFIKYTKSWIIYDFNNYVWNISKDIFPVELIQLIRNCRIQMLSIAPKTVFINKLLNSWKIPIVVENIIKSLKAFSNIFINEIPQPPPHLLNVNNGVINLKTGELLPHNHKFFFTYIIPVNYDPNVESKIINNFFESILPDTSSRKALLRFLGYCLTGETKEQKALFICDKTGTGKSVLFNILKSLFQSFFTFLPIGALQFHKHKNNNAATTELNNLYNKRLSVIDEIPYNYNLDSNIFNKIISGATLMLRFLYQEFFETKNSSKLILSGNKIPKFFNFNDDLFYRKFIIINLSQICMDKSEDSKILLNNLSSFLALLVKEAILYYRDGLLNSESVENNRVDFINEYILTHCNLDKNNRVKRKDILTSIREAYPEQTKFFNDKTLVTLLLNNKNISMYKLNGYLTFKGINIL